MTKNDEIVVTLHGLANFPLHMWRLERQLKKAGYDVANWGYNSLRGGLQEQMDRLSVHLPELKGYKKVHGIGHSLGGLMLRGLFAKNEKKLPLGRLVMMGSPNQGAGVIRRHNWLFGHGPLNRKIIRDLEEGSPVLRQLGVPDMEIGVIAGVTPFSPINPLTWLDSMTIGHLPHDGTVEAHNTRLPGMKDYLELPVTHVALPFHRDVMDASIRFLKTGAFKS